jgi:hypothetical protein
LPCKVARQRRQPRQNKLEHTAKKHSTAKAQRQRTAKKNGTAKTINNARQRNTHGKGQKRPTAKKIHGIPPGRAHHYGPGDGAVVTAGLCHVPYRQARQRFEPPNSISPRKFPAILFYNPRKWPARMIQRGKLLCRVSVHGKGFFAV